MLPRTGLYRLRKGPFPQLQDTRLDLGNLHTTCAIQLLGILADYLLYRACAHPPLVEPRKSCDF